MDLPLRFAVPLLIRPHATWRAIADARTPLVTLAFAYVVPLGAVGPIATYVQRVVVGYRVGNVVYRASPAAACAEAIYGFELALAGVLLVAALVFLLAPWFGARRDFGGAVRVAAFAYTPVWLAAVVVLVPRVGFVELLALAYEIFLLHVGLATVLGVPRGKAGGLAALAMVGAILIAVGFAELSALVVRG